MICAVLVAAGAVVRYQLPLFSLALLSFVLSPFPVSHLPIPPSPSLIPIIYPSPLLMLMFNGRSFAINDEYFFLVYIGQTFNAAAAPLLQRHLSRFVCHMVCSSFYLLYLLYIFTKQKQKQNKSKQKEEGKHGRK